MDTVILFVILTIFVFVPVLVIGIIAILLSRDKKQEQHAILRNYPLLGRIRYFSEQISPELRQYFFADDNEQPFSRSIYQGVVRAGKYLGTIIPFGSKRNFEEAGYYLNNAPFPKLMEEMAVDNTDKINTKKYVIDSEGLLRRKEHRENIDADPWLLTDENAVVIGKETCEKPFVTKGLIGMSAMSYGALGKNAIQALSIGLGEVKGAWMNTGEGGISPYHLEGNAPLIAQIGPAYFGFRDQDGNFSWEEFKKWSDHDNVVAFELKLGQGAKIRGGHVEGAKITPEIAEIRGVEPWKTIDSPNRFKDFEDYDGLLDFITRMRDVSGKPVGFKMVVGNRTDLEELAAAIVKTGLHPDFITIDGAEGGTGATYKSMADSVGLPLKSALLLAKDVFHEYKIRDKFKLIASGKLVEADRIAIALSMGADLVQIARGFMISVGCIGAMKCHTNECPVGVATTDDNLQKALVVGEKRYRVTNYVLTLRQDLFAIAAACGIDCPSKFNDYHVVYKESNGAVYTMNELTQHQHATPGKQLIS